MLLLLLSGEFPKAFSFQSSLVAAIIKAARRIAYLLDATHMFLRLSPFLAVVGAATLCSSTTAAGAEPSSGIPVIRGYCVGCHGGQKPKADLTLDVQSIDFGHQTEM